MQRFSFPLRRADVRGIRSPETAPGANILLSPKGAPVFAVASGVVKHAKSAFGMGALFVESEISQGKLDTIYVGLAAGADFPSVGSAVLAGQRLGFVYRDGLYIETALNGKTAMRALALLQTLRAEWPSAVALSPVHWALIAGAGLGLLLLARRR